VSDGVRIQWQGLDKVIHGFARAGKVTPAQRQADMLQAVRDAGTIQLAQQLAPRHAGGPSHGSVHGADTITVQPEKSAVSGGAAVAIGPTNEGWWLRFAEIGTYKWAGKPWLRPAVAATLNAIVHAIGLSEVKRLHEGFRL
jgi:HK97 gp10 family phage protein